MPLQHDISQNYALKSAIEDLFGKKAWLDLKETTSINTWRKYLVKTLKAIRISINESIEIADNSWKKSIKENLDRGEQELKKSKNIEDMISIFSAILLRQVFLQTGMLPDRKSQESVTLKKEYWKLNSFRNVIYIQSEKQQEAEFWNKQQKQIGFQRQMELKNEYKCCKSELSYSKWCKKKGV